MKALTFWFSAEHAESVSSGHKCYVTVLGVKEEYTACRPVCKYGEIPKEPYDGAMSRFPDYELICLGVETDISTERI